MSNQGGNVDRTVISGPSLDDNSSGTVPRSTNMRRGEGGVSGGGVSATETLPSQADHGLQTGVRGKPTMVGPGANPEYGNYGTDVANGVGRQHGFDDGHAAASKSSGQIDVSRHGYHCMCGFTSGSREQTQEHIAGCSGTRKRHGVSEGTQSSSATGSSGGEGSSNGVGSSTAVGSSGAHGSAYGTDAEMGGETESIDDLKKLRVFSEELKTGLKPASKEAQGTGASYHGMSSYEGGDNGGGAFGAYSHGMQMGAGGFGMSHGIRGRSR